MAFPGRVPPDCMVPLLHGTFIAWYLYCISWYLYCLVPLLHGSDFSLPLAELAVASLHELKECEVT